MSAIQTMHGALVNLSDKVDRIAATVSGTQADVAAIGATLTGSKARHEEEIGILFRKHDEHLARTQKIEVDYVPRGEFRLRHDEHTHVHDQQREDHEALSQRVGCIETKVIKLGLIAGGVISVLQIAVYALAHWLMR